MIDNFNLALTSILTSEGFYDGKKGEMNDPDDTGGFTVAGMTVRNFTSYYRLPNVSDVHNPPETIKQQMRALTEEHLGPYYKREKWDTCRCDELPPGIDFSVADVSTLHGFGRARQFYRRSLALGDSMKPLLDSEIDRVWKDDVDWDLVIHSIGQQRLNHYHNIVKNKPSQRKWLKGWTNRTQRITAQCCSMAPDRSGFNVADIGKPEEIEGSIELA